MMTRTLNEWFTIKAQIPNDDNLDFQINNVTFVCEFIYKFISYLRSYTHTHTHTRTRTTHILYFFIFKHKLEKFSLKKNI